jgi:hypothetical protein
LGIPGHLRCPQSGCEYRTLNPPVLGGVAVANVSNTLYAHVWNLGKAPAYRVRVEFYWFNPSLGISRTDANRGAIGAGSMPPSSSIFFIFFPMPMRFRTRQRRALSPSNSPNSPVWLTRAARGGNLHRRKKLATPGGVCVFRADWKMIETNPRCAKEFWNISEHVSVFGVM